MSESGLYAVTEASMNWQIAIQENQEVTATTINQASALLMTIYTNSQNALDALMEDDTNSGDSVTNYDPSHGKPPSSWADKDGYSSDVQIWSTYYSQQSQDWENVENGVDTPLQSMNTQEQSLGNSSAQASQVTTTMIGPMKNTATLLSAAL